MSRRTSWLQTILSFSILPALLIGAVGCDESSGGDPAVGTGDPRLEIVGGDTIDWGEVGGGALEHELKLVNAGGEVLTITEVKPACGCTTAPIDKDELASGDTATIKVTMDVATRTGPTEKTITITTNDSTNPNRIVYLRANVVREVYAEPPYFAITNPAAGQSGSATISLVNSGTAPVTIQPPTVTGTTVMHVSFDMTGPKTLQPGESVPVTATAMSPDDKPAQVPVVFATDNPKNPEITVTLNVTSVPTQAPEMTQIPAPGN